MATGSPPIVIVHADESCLGNGADGENPGGAGALIDVFSGDTIVRRDIYISSPDTTNNRMALCGAIAVFAILSQKGKRLKVTYVSDSEYLVKGMTEWVPAWKAKNWRRKGGALKNVELWQTLDRTAAPHDITWEWVRGHAGHPKNEYADHLAVKAATHQLNSDGTVPSQFDAWFERVRNKKQFADYDPDIQFAQAVARIEGSA
jgi:ribonuclease HI